MCPSPFWTYLSSSPASRVKSLVSSPVSLSLSVCKKLGIKEDVALKGMLKTKPDPGALLIWNLNYKSKKNQFVSAFAANDPDSTLKVWDLIKNKSNYKKCIFLNCRDDRRYRTIQLINLIHTKIKPDLLIVRGDNVKPLIADMDNSKIKLFDMSSDQLDVINFMVNLNQHFIVGIGNIVGWGDLFLKKLKEYSK